MTIKMKIDGKLVEVGGAPAPVVNQNASGIAVGGTALQDASTSQDGLMTKEQVASLNGKASTSAVQTAQSKADSAYNLANGKLDAGANAVSATKATNDSSNRNIVNTYATKTEAQAAQNKADSAYNLANGKLGKSENAVSATKATNDGQNRNIASTYALKTDITSVYKVMGSCTTAQLAGKAKNKGDVWNLTDAGSYGGAGTNVVYTGTEWDALGGTIDLSGYATTGAVQTAQSKADSAYNLANGKADASALAGYVPTSRTINNKALASNISLGASDVGALPSDGKANTAGTADKAINDGSNRNIVNTYATKTELNGKVDKSGSTMSGDLSVPSLYAATSVSSAGSLSAPWVQVNPDKSNHATSIAGYDGIFIRRNDGYIYYRSFDEIKADLGISSSGDSLNKSGGIMTGTTSSVLEGQVRNIHLQTRPPNTGEGMNGDIWCMYE